MPLLFAYGKTGFLMTWLICQVLVNDVINSLCRKKCNDLFRYVSRAQVGVVLQCLMYAVFPLVGAREFS